MPLTNLKILQNINNSNGTRNEPMRAPPSALSKSAESLITKKRQSRNKSRSTEEQNVLLRGSSVTTLPALVKQDSFKSSDSYKTHSRNGSTSSRNGSLDRISGRGSSNTILRTTEDNIQVVVRVRPFTQEELRGGDDNTLEFPGRGQIVCKSPIVGQSPKLFSYNVVFEHGATQSDVLEYSGIKRLLEMAVEGFSCTAFCYGQTGSGKTHTLTGPPGLVESGSNPHSDEHGLVVRSFIYLFQLLQSKPECRYILKASYLEIYNEKVIDLLNPGTARKPLQVRWSKESRSFYVENLFMVDCEELDDLFAVLEEGMHTRAVGSHAMNANSSRSHTLLCVRVMREHTLTDKHTTYTHGKINFVDLAGSELTKRTKSTGATLNEANNINRSLMVLGYCIASLSDNRNKRGHIPYRDSKLTKLLADSLAGNGVTLMIACISPSKYNMSETINTLRYAARAKKIKIRPVVKMDARDALIISLKREVNALQQENQHLRAALHMHQPIGNNITSNDSKLIKMNSHQMKDMKESQLVQLEPSELIELVKLYMSENSSLRDENDQLFNIRDSVLREHEVVCRENERLLKKLEDVNSVCCRSPIIPARSTFSGPADGTNSTNIWTNPHGSSSNSVVSNGS